MALLLWGRSVRRRRRAAAAKALRPGRLTMQHSSGEDAAYLPAGLAAKMGAGSAGKSPGVPRIHVHTDGPSVGQLGGTDDFEISSMPAAAATVIMDGAPVDAAALATLAAELEEEEAQLQRDLRQLELMREGQEGYAPAAPAAVSGHAAAIMDGAPVDVATVATLAAELQQEEEQLQRELAQLELLRQQQQEGQQESNEQEGAWPMQLKALAAELQQETQSPRALTLRERQQGAFSLQHTPQQLAELAAELQQEEERLQQELALQQQAQEGVWPQQLAALAAELEQEAQSPRALTLREQGQGGTWLEHEHQPEPEQPAALAAELQQEEEQLQQELAALEQQQQRPTGRVTGTAGEEYFTPTAASTSSAATTPASAAASAVAAEARSAANPQQDQPASIEPAPSRLVALKIPRAMQATDSAGLSESPSYRLAAESPVWVGARPAALPVPPDWEAPPVRPRRRSSLLSTNRPAAAPLQAGVRPAGAAAGPGRTTVGLPQARRQATAAQQAGDPVWLSNPAATTAQEQEEQKPPHVTLRRLSEALKRARREKKPCLKPNILHYFP